MKITITKHIDNYSMKISSGHFTGTLENIPEDVIAELKNSLDSIYSGKIGHTTSVVWNKRSGRHEVIHE